MTCCVTTLKSRIQTMCCVLCKWLDYIISHNHKYAMDVCTNCVYFLLMVFSNFLRLNWNSWNVLDEFWLGLELQVKFLSFVRPFLAFLRYFLLAEKKVVMKIVFSISCWQRILINTANKKCQQKFTEEDRLLANIFLSTIFANNTFS